MPKIESLADLRKIKESAADRIAARSEGRARVIADGRVVQDLAIGKAE